MEKIYTLYGCGHMYVTETKLRERFENNRKNCPNGWANQYESFKDYLERGKKGGWLVE